MEGFENIPIITSESQTTGINPAIDVFPGNLDFQVNVPTQGHKSKEAHVSEIWQPYFYSYWVCHQVQRLSFSFQYSNHLKKLYINQNRFINLEFKIFSDYKPDIEFTLPSKNELFVRAICIFLNADDYPIPVKVCYTHSRDSIGVARSSICEHLVRCSHAQSTYHQDLGKFLAFSFLKTTVDCRMFLWASTRTFFFNKSQLPIFQTVTYYTFFFKSDMSHMPSTKKMWQQRATLNRNIVLVYIRYSSKVLSTVL